MAALSLELAHWDLMRSYVDAGKASRPMVEHDLAHLLQVAAASLRGRGKLKRLDQQWRLHAGYQRGL